MAKLQGIVPLQGTVGNITFAKTEAGIIAKEKASVSRERIAEDPRSEGTRVQNNYLSQSSETGRLIRQAFSPAVFGAIDSACNTRLAGRLRRVLDSDRAHTRDARRLQDGDFSILEGFEFNESSPLRSRLFRKHEIGFDRATGMLRLDFDAFYSHCIIGAPKGTTHFSIILSGALIDLGQLCLKEKRSSLDMIPYGQGKTEAFSLTVNLGAASTRPLFVVLGIEYYKLVHRSYCPLEDGRLNSMALVSVEKCLE